MKTNIPRRPTLGGRIGCMAGVAGGRVAGVVGCDRGGWMGRSGGGVVLLGSGCNLQRFLGLLLLRLQLATIPKHAFCGLCLAGIGRPLRVSRSLALSGARAKASRRRLPSPATTRRQFLRSATTSTVATVAAVAAVAALGPLAALAAPSKTRPGRQGLPKSLPLASRRCLRWRSPPVAWALAWTTWVRLSPLLARRQGWRPRPVAHGLAQLAGPKTCGMAGVARVRGVPALGRGGRSGRTCGLQISESHRIGRDDEECWHWAARQEWQEWWEWQEG